jgi:hypothetical protein
VALVEDELGPSLTSAQLMRAPVTERLLPDLSVSNEALLNSLRPAAENTLSLRASRLARGQSERALYWFGTRPRALRQTLSQEHRKQLRRSMHQMKPSPQQCPRTRISAC